MDKNVNQTAEFQLAKQVENGINSFCFNPSNFAAAVLTMHPTLQQSLYRTIKECIKVMANNNYIDERNRASHEEAKAIMAYLDENERYIPFI
ncbi:hypothetical protein [Bacteroides sp.]|uniref:hypothetical protein n=1 Tax=Bacteroides sp. TaxID=29523 RepID=UPI00261E9B87|nr:hypothetical protein [Bacteroides sp.]MDD3038098.1 hypothetical protein [Bacteroides sp.]